MSGLVIENEYTVELSLSDIDYYNVIPTSGHLYSLQWMERNWYLGDAISVIAKKTSSESTVWLTN